MKTDDAYYQPMPDSNHCESCDDHPIVEFDEDGFRLSFGELEDGVASCGFTPDVLILIPAHIGENSIKRFVSLAKEFIKVWKSP